MKKFISIVIGFVMCSFVFAEEFSWADYEVLCAMYGTEPSYSEYIYLCENPQCYGDSEDECLSLFSVKESE